MKISKKTFFITNFILMCQMIAVYLCLSLIDIMFLKILLLLSIFILVIIINNFLNKKTIQKNETEEMKFVPYKDEPTIEPDSVLQKYLDEILAYAVEQGFSPTLSATNEDGIAKLWLATQIMKNPRTNEIEVKRLIEIIVFENVKYNSSDYKAFLTKMKEQIDEYKKNNGVI